MGMITLVRHGQASFGTDDYDRLSSLGKAQSATLGAHLRHAGRLPDLVLVGGMRRQHETYQALADAAGWDHVPVREDPAWDEYDHEAIVSGAERPGPADPGQSPVSAPGRTVATGDNVTFQRRLDAALVLWTRATRGGRFGEETWTQFHTRNRAGLDRAAAEAGPGRWVVVVTSAGPISLACARLAVAPPPGDADGAPDEATLRLWPALNRVLVNSSQSRVVVGRSGLTMLSFNEHQHLAPDQVTSR
ncbi:histidine phosphatase family protein [Ornithinimicrobium sufpigmenti]|uniref:histidine phosphatase family protein n=1 Tax=Ornithinimicrobium sufpigmenti TaxID=2508882 RepID=UPI001035D1E2|nr:MULTISPECIES: histidine phosphatase family protein [unclassified Ornithinimicrobium]